jgi:hypothetical protein
MSSLSRDPIVTTTMIGGPATEALERSSFKRRRVSNSEDEANNKKPAFEMDDLFQQLRQDDDDEHDVFPTINWDFNDSSDNIFVSAIKRSPCSSRRCSDPEVQKELELKGGDSIRQEERIRRSIMKPRPPLTRSQQHHSCGALSQIMKDKRPIGSCRGMVRSKAFSFPLFGLDAETMMRHHHHHHHHHHQTSEEAKLYMNELKGGDGAAADIDTSKALLCSRKRITPPPSKISLPLLPLPAGWTTI